jgi:hypothetical protein
MAGAGYKLFQTGDVLTAAQVNTYLNEQTVMVFANAAARTSALTSVLAEGMVSYLQDTNAVEVYNGSAWVGIANAGDITAVNVTSPITGGGSSGDVTISIQDGTTAQKGAIQLEDSTSSTSTTKAATPNSVKSAYDLANAAIAKSLIDAEGDLIVGDAADAVQRLAIGSNGNVLTVDTSIDGKIKWAAPAGGGKVLQVVNATYNTSTTVASTTFADTGLSLSITPSATNSKILVFAEQSTYNESSNQATAVLEIRLLRDATSIQDFKGVSYVNIGATGGSNLLVRAPISYLDSPNTTSATTYKIQGRVASTANSAQAIFQVSSSVSTITLLEIGA